MWIGSRLAVLLVLYSTIYGSTGVAKAAKSKSKPRMLQATGTDEPVHGRLSYRQSRVIFDADTLVDSSQVVEVKLFKDVTLILQPTRRSTGAWFGSVVDDPEGDVTLLFDPKSPKTSVVGTISTRRAVYQLNTRADGSTWVTQTNWAGFPREAHRNMAQISTDEYRTDSKNNRERRGAKDDGSVIDVLVPYTTRAMCREAGLDYPCKDTAQNRKPIEALVELAVEETNKYGALHPF